MKNYKINGVKFVTHKSVLFLLYPFHKNFLLQNKEPKNLCITSIFTGMRPVEDVHRFRFE